MCHSLSPKHLGLLLLAAGLASPAPAKADSLDRELVKNVPAILGQARLHEYRVVGVLPFKVDKGKGEGYDNAPLCREMPLRLENALIMANNTSNPIIVLRDVAPTAARAKAGAWATSPAGRKPLFAIAYPAAWGGKREKADAFLTGTITCTGDRAKTTVVVQAFDAKDPTKLHKLHTFTVNTDRALLGELGYSFSLPKQSLVSARSPAKRDKLALQLVKRRDAGSGDGRVDPEDVGGASFQLLYNDAPQQLAPIPGASAGNEFAAPPIPPGAKVSMMIGPNGRRNERLALLLKINGESSFERETAEPLACRKWIYEAGARPDAYVGFYEQDKGEATKLKVFPFKVSRGNEVMTKVSSMGADAGWITLQVFVSGAKGEGDELVVSTRGLSRRLIAKRGPVSLDKLQKEMLAANGIKRKKSLVVIRGVEPVLLESDTEAAERLNLKETTFPNVTRVGELRIRYSNFGGSGDLSISN